MSYSYNENKMVKNQMEVDHKIIKRIYPRTNNKTSLEFILEKDPNLYLRLHSLKLYFNVSFPSTYSMDIAAGAKMFSDLRIDLDSQSINSSSSKWVTIFISFLA